MRLVSLGEMFGAIAVWFSGDRLDCDDIRGSVEKHLSKDTVDWIRIVTECLEGTKLHGNREEKTTPQFTISNKNTARLEFTWAA